ncbi:hypothetical protein Vadar_028662 [Vaccinium darrowii]|uniref:Uncharacterized protein n=1 Tax=Vaccinium darrowii TaxID=229202 RepID=A0ACB7Y3Q8_9ERIC|nr:hypothetical protein Vadar_028662 [Vaccinium darrowii]
MDHNPLCACGKVGSFIISVGKTTKTGKALVHTTASEYRTLIRPRGFGPTSSSVGSVHEAYDASMLHALSAYYQDPIVASSLKTWALEVLCYYESFPNPTVRLNATPRKFLTSTKWERIIEILKESITSPPPAASGVSVNPLIEPQENPTFSAVKKIGKKTEDLETKTRKLMEEGVAPNAVRVCTICNVVCNSDLVFAHHNVGKKHALKLLMIGT